MNLALSGPAGAALITGRDQAELSILDDNVGGTIQFGAATYTVTEGVGTASITVIRTGSTAGGATIDLAGSDGTATAGSDYTATATTVVFGPNEVSKTVPVPIVDDTDAEGVETITLTLTNPGPNATTKLGPRSTAVLRVVDNELALAFTALTSTVRENSGLAVVTVELTGVNVTPVAVSWATNGVTAVAGSDYGVRGSLTEPSGTLTFAPGGTATTVRTRTFTVPILSDTILEDTKTLTVMLTGTTGGLIVSGRDALTLSITDDDLGGTIQFGAATYTVVESVGNAAITVIRTGSVAAGATVDVATSDGTAIAGTDYTTTTTTLVFGQGETTKTVLVPIIDDGTADGVHTVNLTLSNPGPNATTKLGARTTAVLRIVDNEPALAFATPTYSVREGGVVATITVELTGVNVTPITVGWATTGVSAAAGSDYGVRNSPTEPSGTLTFAPGGSALTVRTRTFTVPILQDTLVEGTETLDLALNGPVGAGLVAGRDTASLLILDDDVGGVVQLSAPLFTVTECAAQPCNATVMVARTGGAASEVTVDFATADGTAIAGVGADYTASSGTVTFGAGQTSRPIVVPILTEPGSSPPSRSRSSSATRAAAPRSAPVPRRKSASPTRGRARPVGQRCTAGTQAAVRPAIVSHRMRSPRAVRASGS